MKRNRNEGISLCAVQRIVDHPDWTIDRVASFAGVNRLTVRKVRQEVGQKTGSRSYVPNPRWLCQRAGSIDRALELLEAHGLDNDVTYKQVEEWCRCGKGA